MQPPPPPPPPDAPGRGAAVPSAEPGAENMVITSLGAAGDTAGVVEHVAIGQYINQPNKALGLGEHPKSLVNL